MSGTLIEVKGQQRTGKTTACVKAWNRLYKRYIPVTRGGGWIEIKGGILEVDGIRVGFMTKSEPPSALQNELEHLRDEGCRVIVCASHRAGTLADQEVERFCQNFVWQRVPILTSRNLNEDEQAADNDRIAGKVVDAVLTAVKRLKPRTA
jgi:hypothetical protein